MDDLFPTDRLAKSALAEGLPLRCLEMRADLSAIANESHYHVSNIPMQTAAAAAIAKCLGGRLDHA